LFVVRLVLVFPLVEVKSEPVVLGLLLDETVPKRPDLFLLERELDDALANRKLGLLKKAFFKF
jgi:hypothetical protein